MRTTTYLQWFFLLASSSPLHAQGASVKDTVLANERRFSELQIQRKCEEAAQFLAEDFQGTDGPPDSKSDFLNTCKAGSLITTAEKFSNVEFTLNAPNTAVVAYLDDGDFILNNKPIKAHMRVDSVWVKHGSKWLMHLHTSSSIPFAVTEEGRLKLLYFDSSDHLDEGADQKEKDAKKELIQLEKQWAEAGVKGDIGFFERIAAADYVIVDCDGSVRNKQQEIVNFRPEVQTSSTVEDMKVRIYDGSAVVVGAFTITGTYACQPNNLSGTFTDVWIRPNRTWQLVSTQNTCKAAEGAQNANPAVDKTETAKGDAEKELIQLEKQRAEEELKGLENEAVQAELRADMPVIDRIFSDDWITVDEEAQARNKKAEFEPFKTGEEKVTAGRLDDMSARLFGEAAVVIGSYMFEGSFQGKPFDIKGRFTDVWASRNGRWQIVSSQNTAISEANATEFPPDPFFIAKEKEIWEALKRKDKSAATRLLADDFVGMYGFGFFSKSEWVKQIDEQYAVDDYTIENAKVLHPSANTALLLYNSNCKGTGTWTEFCSHASRISDLFVKRNGQWVALFSQDTD